MTIREIADIAGVSPSTVSKIINGKDENITEKTRSHVLEIVKKYNYTPYTALLSQAHNTYLIGLLVRNDYNNKNFIQGVSDEALNHGYGVIVCFNNSLEDEQRNIAMLSSRSIQGIIWQPVAYYNEKSEKQINKLDVPVHITDSQRKSTDTVAINYKKLGYTLAKHILDKKHEKIACFIPVKNTITDRFIQGYIEAVSKYANKKSKDNIFLLDKNNINLMSADFTGAVCFNVEIAAKLYKTAKDYNLNISRDLSIVAIDDSDESHILNPRLSSIKPYYKNLGAVSVNNLVNLMEKRSNKNNSLNLPLSTSTVVGDSVDVPLNIRGKKIVVVGVMNIDILIELEKIPSIGSTARSSNLIKMPGGKAVNQAIGAAKLGAEVYIMGSVGNDYEANLIYHELQKENVDTSGVQIDKYNATGNAYIYVEKTGESSIVLYEGANTSLTPSDIVEKEKFFENANYTLLQTEINISTIEKAAEVAKFKKSKVILKPSAISSISDNMLKNIDIFVPNLNEINILAPMHLKSLEEKAQYFINKGVKQVIVTLSEKGCYLHDSRFSKYFEAADFEAVDTTGAADAFIAALAVYLSENYSIETSIKYANYAAGFSITRKGVPSSLVDRLTLDAAIKNF